MLRRLWQALIGPGYGEVADLAAKATPLMEAGDYAAALEALKIAGGWPTAELRAMLGECLYQLNRADEALSHTRDALKLARLGRDNELSLALMGNLLEIHRRRGDGPAAAAMAREFAVAYDRVDEQVMAARYRRWAELLEGGEPPLRVAADFDGVPTEVAEVVEGKRSGAVRLVYVRNRQTLRPCEELTRKGEEAANAGEYDRAHELLLRAVEADPFAPEPFYLAGHVSVYERKYREAANCFNNVEHLAPGWFHVATAAALVKRLFKGEIPVEVYRAWHVATEGPLPAEVRLAELERATTQFPTLGILHQARGRILRERGLGVAAERALRDALRYATEEDAISRACVDLAAVVSDREEMRQLLWRAVTPGADLRAAAMARIVGAAESEKG